ncbi:TonB-dependent receptor plug domain-containing protein [Shewanella youngdeokensis]|uniref:TonB-dependent receptor n=1 Tax=Shewanella youngdeokensis TaxID=2999068 RepID=A0ABZ0JYW5_9GAMM|nr:TonB-dependent receptor [Shewanella sp. DAU334]
MKNNNALKLSTIALALGVAFQAQASELERDPILDVTEVIVVHGEQPAAIESSTTHWSLDAEDIKALGAQSLDQLLKNVPGLYVRVGGEGTPRVDVRGFKARHVVYLINGVPANGAEEGQFDPSLIPASQIASVEVSVGPTSVLYGPGGAGGVINIITKRGDNSPSLSGRLEVADDDTFNGDISAAGSGEKWQGMINYTHQQTDGWAMSDDYEKTEYQQDDTRQNADKTLDNVYAQGSYLLSDDTQLLANMTYRQGEWGKPSRDGTGTGTVKFERVEDFEEVTAQLGVAHKFNSMFTLRGFAYHNQSDVIEIRYKNDSFDTIKTYQDGRSVVQGGNVQFISNFDQAGILTTALIAEKQGWKSLSESPSSSTVSILGDGSGGGGGSGGDDGIERLDDDAWLYTAALEYQYQGEGYGFTLGGAGHEHDRELVSESDFSGQVSGYWQPHNDTRINMGVARKVRFPSMRNLYALSSGNAELQQEVSQHVELGLVQAIGNATEFNIAGYYTDAEDYIAKDTSSVYQNMGDYVFKGVDLQLQNNSFDNLSMTIAYSFLDTEDKTAAADMKNLEHRPRHKVHFNAQYQLPFAMQINLNVERIMDQIYYAEQEVAGVDMMVEQSLADYTLVDLNVVQPLLDDKLDLYIRATNLLDESYYQSEALPQAGRQVFIGINWQI